MIDNINYLGSLTREKEIPYDTRYQRPEGQEIPATRGSEEGHRDPFGDLMV